MVFFDVIFMKYLFGAADMNKTFEETAGQERIVDDTFFCGIFSIAPYVVYQLELPESLFNKKGLLVMLWDTLWLYVLIIVCGIHVQSGFYYYRVSLSITTYCLVMPWIVFLAIRYMKANLFTKYGWILLIFGFWFAFINDIISSITGISSESSIFDANLKLGFSADNLDVLNGNIMLIILIVFGIAGIILLILGRVSKKRIDNMKRTKKIVVLLLVGVLFLQSQITVFAAPENIGTQIEGFVEEHADTTAGMSVSVFDKNGTIYKNYFGYADIEKKLAVEEETVFEWGSATKLLVWVSIMQLWEQGKIDMDADVKEYLPKDFLTNLNYDTPITMTNLMNHNAGFQEMLVEIFVPEGTKVISLEAALAAHKPEQVYEPGAVTAYSNWGVALAGYIVERISGMEFSEYVHENIFEPLGMEHSAIMPDLSDNPWVLEKRKQLQCYTVDGTLLPECFYQITLYPAGMCTSTLEDFETFGRALLDENSVLFQSKDTLKELLSPTDYYGDTGVPANCHGFWMVPYEKQVYGHGGNTAGCSSYLLIEPETGVGVVVMTNQSNETVYNGEMMDLLFGKFKEADYFDKKRDLPEGIFRVSRVVLKGPLKVLSLTYTFGEEEQDQFWVYENSETKERIRYPYTDFIPVSTGEFVLEMGLFLGWIFILIFTVTSMFACLIMKLVKKMKHKPKVKNPLDAWSLLAGSLQLLVLMLILLAISMISGYALSSAYVWIFAVLGGIGLIMPGMAVYGIIKGRKSGCSLKRKIYHTIIILGLFITVCNIFYWDLYAFWAL